MGGCGWPFGVHCVVSFCHPSLCVCALVVRDWGVSECAGDWVARCHPSAAARVLLSFHCCFCREGICVCLVLVYVLWIRVYIYCDACVFSSLLCSWHSR